MGGMFLLYAVCICLTFLFYKRLRKPLYFWICVVVSFLFFAYQLIGSLYFSTPNEHDYDPFGYFFFFVIAFGGLRKIYLKEMKFEPLLTNRFDSIQDHRKFLISDYIFSFLVVVLIPFLATMATCILLRYAI